jgi:hypothetical protein
MKSPLILKGFLLSGKMGKSLNFPNSIESLVWFVAFNPGEITA